MTVSFLNCSGDKSCLCGGTLLSTGPMEFYNLQNVHRKRTSYLLIIAEGNPVELYQLLLPNSVVVNICLNPCQVLSASHFSVQPSRYAGILITRSGTDIQVG